MDRHHQFLKDLRSLLAASLLLIGSVSLFGVEQRPLVINPTTGKQEQLQPTNSLSAGVLATGSTTIRTLQNRAAEWVNVMDFGAVADGNYTTGSGTDNGPAFAAAIASKTPSATVSIAVFVPAGVFRIGTRVDIPSGYSFVGAGSWATYLFCASAYASDVIRFNGTGGQPSTLSNMSINAQVGGAFSATGINALANGTFINNVWVNGFGTGIVLASSDQFLSEFAVELCTTGITVTSNDVNVCNGTVYGNSDGLVVNNGGATAAGKVLVTNVRATEGTLSGFVVTNGKNVMLSNCAATHVNAGRFSVAGFLVNGTSNNVCITGCTAELGSVSTTAYGVSIAGSSNFVSVVGGFYKGWLDGINVTTDGTAVILNGVNTTGNGANGINVNWTGPQLSIVGCVSTYNGTAAGGDCGINVTSGGPFQNLIVSQNVVDQGGGGAQEYSIQITNNNATTKGSCQGNVTANANTANINIVGTSLSTIAVTGVNN